MSDIAFYVACFAIGYGGTLLIAIIVVSRYEIADWFTTTMRRIFK